MAELYIGDIKLESIDAKSTAQKHLCFCDSDGNIKYIPLLTSTTDQVTYNDYGYSAVTPTAYVSDGSQIFLSANQKKSLSDIPAGTYTPSTFSGMLMQFLPSIGSTKKVKEGFESIVNSQSFFTNSGVAIGRYKNASSSYNGSSTVEVISMGGTRFTTNYFGELLREYNSYGFYIVGYQAGSSDAYSKGGAYYNDYPITLTSGIKFE